jgi:RNA polymerase sigma factor (sigma-70 family)
VATGSITIWFKDLQEGDHGAAQWIWDRYGSDMLRVARQRLERSADRTADEEDLVQSAFHSLCRGAQEGQFAEVQDRDELWRLMVVITARKAINRMQHQRRHKRLPTKLAARIQQQADFELADLIDSEPTPEFAADMDEACARLLDSLEDKSLQRIVLYKMQGYSHEEIARRMRCVPRTISRKLQMIRQKWESEISP